MNHHKSSPSRSSEINAALLRQSDQTTPVPPGCTVSAPMLMEAPVAPLRASTVSVSGVKETVEALLASAYFAIQTPPPVVPAYSRRLLESDVSSASAETRPVTGTGVEPKLVESTAAGPRGCHVAVAAPGPAGATAAGRAAARVRQLARVPALACVHPRWARKRWAATTRGGRLGRCAAAQESGFCAMAETAAARNMAPKSAQAHDAQSALRQVGYAQLAAPPDRAGWPGIRRWIKLVTRIRISAPLLLSLIFRGEVSEIQWIWPCATRRFRE